MNIVFHSNQLSIRGTETALYDYAHYNETLLGNVSYIMAPANSDMASYEKFLQRFGDRVILYTDFLCKIKKCQYFLCESFFVLTCSDCR